MAITNFISTVWSENLLKQLEQKYIGVLHCNREFEGDIKNTGSKVKICGLGSVSVLDYEKNSDMNSPDLLTDCDCILEINRAKYFNFQIDDVDKAQSTPKLMDEAMKNAADALAREADQYIYSLHSNADYVEHFDLSAGNSIIDAIIKMKTDLIKASGALSDDIIIEVSPDVAALIIKEKMDIGSDNYDTLEAGLLGKVVGCKVYVTNNVAIGDDGEHKCFMRTKRAVAFAEQISEIEAYRPEKRFADAVKGLHLYGAKVVYPEEFFVMSTKLA